MTDTRPDRPCARCGKPKPELGHGRLALRLDVARDDYCSTDCCKAAHGIAITSKVPVTK